MISIIIRCLTEKVNSNLKKKKKRKKSIDLMCVNNLQWLM